MGKYRCNRCNDIVCKDHGAKITPTREKCVLVVTDVSGTATYVANAYRVIPCNIGF